MNIVHVCKSHCDVSHKYWDKYFPNDPILVGEVIHHKDFDHDNNKKYNLQKMMDSAHKILHATGKNHPLYGTQHSEETKRKIGLKSKGRVCSKETRLKMSKVRLGVPKSEEHKKKIGESQKGKIISEETKREIRMTKLRLRKERVAA